MRLLALSLLVTGCADPCSKQMAKGLPNPTGDFAVGATARNLIADDRTLAVTTFYPAVGSRDDRPWATEVQLDWMVETGRMVNPPRDWTVAATTDAPGANGDFPGVLFSPGLGNPSAVYSSLLIDLASRGVMVHAIDHPGISGIVEYAETYEPQADRVPYGPADELHATVVADLEAAQLELGAAAAFGHSLGGSAAIQMCANTETLTACLNLDGTQYGPV